MAISLSTALSEAWGKTAGSMSELYTQGGGLTIYQGYPAFSFRSDGTTALPASGTISLGMVDGCIFQHHCSGVTFEATVSGGLGETGNGVRPPVSHASNANTTFDLATGTATGSGQTATVMGNYSGGTSDQYGVETAPATLDSITFTAAAAGRWGYEAAAITDESVLGTYDIVPATTGSIVGASTVYLIGYTRTRP